MELNIKNTMKRTTIKIGDIFVVKLEDYQKYFQYIADDMTMLNSSVIRSFIEKYPLGRTPIFNDVINGEVEFYAHTSLKLGVKMGLWEKVGNNPDTGSTGHILFRRSKDYGHGSDGKRVELSSRWEVWKINEEFNYIGKLQGESRKAEIGSVKPPNEIVERMKTGQYSYYYPGFE